MASHQPDEVKAELQAKEKVIVVDIENQQAISETLIFEAGTFEDIDVKSKKMREYIRESDEATPMRRGCKIK